MARIKDLKGQTDLVDHLAAIQSDLRADDMKYIGLLRYCLGALLECTRHAPATERLQEERLRAQMLLATRD